jgi:hypothetical protein
LPQWAALAADAEAGLPGRGDVDPIAGWAADRARLLVDGEVVLGEPARHRRSQRRRLDRLGVLGGPKRRAGLPAAVGRVTQDFQARLLVVEQLDAGRPVCGVRCGQRALGEQPDSGSAATWAL